MEIVLLPLDQIYDDPKFNCRQQALVRTDVLDLIESIKKTRLENPIVVQPIAEITVITLPPPGVFYRVLNGNRRFTALKCLRKDEPADPRWHTIPSIIRSGLSDDDARALNLRDNLEHLDLNLQQEALALKRWHDAGYGREQVARLIGQSASWVQIRFNLLDLPIALQEYAAKGLIGQGDVKDLYQFRNDMDRLFARAREIIEHRLRGRKAPRVRSKRQQSRAKRPGRPRGKEEIEEMIQHVGDNIGCGLITRLLAWSAGNASTFEIMAEIKQTAEQLGRVYSSIDENDVKHL